MVLWEIWGGGEKSGTGAYKGKLWSTGKREKGKEQATIATEANTSIIR